MQPTDLAPPRNTPSSSEATSSPHPPGHLGKRKNYLSSQGLQKITVKGVQRLAQALAPETVYPKIADLVANCSRELFNRLEAMSLDQEQSLLHAIACVHAVSDEFGSSSFDAEGIPQLEGASIGDRAAFAYLEHQDRFVSALDRRITASPSDTRRSIGFQASQNVTQLPRRVVDDELRTEAKARFNKRFAEKWGPGTTVWIREHDGGVLSLVVERPTPKKGLALFDSLGNPEDLERRLRQTDLVSVDLSSGTLWVTSRVTDDVEYYAREVGTLFWGKEALFTHPIDFELSMFLESNAGVKLNSARKGRVNAIELRYVHGRQKGQSNSNVKKSRTRGCLTETPDWLDRFMPGDIVVEVMIAVQIGVDGPMDRVTVKRNSMSSEGILSRDELIHLLQALELLPSHDN